MEGGNFFKNNQIMTEVKLPIKELIESKNIEDNKFKIIAENLKEIENLKINLSNSKVDFDIIKNFLDDNEIEKMKKTVDDDTILRIQNILFFTGILKEAIDKKEDFFAVPVVSIDSFSHASAYALVKSNGKIGIFCMSDNTNILNDIFAMELSDQENKYWNVIKPIFKESNLYQFALDSKFHDAVKKKDICLIDQDDTHSCPVLATKILSRAFKEKNKVLEVLKKYLNEAKSNKEVHRYKLPKIMQKAFQNLAFGAFVTHEKNELNNFANTSDITEFAISSQNSRFTKHILSVPEKEKNLNAKSVYDTAKLHYTIVNNKKPTAEEKAKIKNNMESLREKFIEKL